MELTNSKQVTKSLIKFGMLFFVMVMFATSCDRGGGRNPVGPAPTKYTVTLNCNPTAGGTVTGAGTYNAGDTIFVTATANSGYQFVNWTHPNGSVAQTNTTARISAISEDWNLTANFQLTGSGSNQHTITLNCNPTAGGTVTGAGTFNAGTSRTVTATPNSGYRFVNWTENGNQVSANSSFNFTLNSNRNLTANFVQQGAITWRVSPANSGTMVYMGTSQTFSGLIRRDYGDTLFATARPNSGWRFVNWSSNLDNNHLTSESIQAIYGDWCAPANNVIITAHFELIPINAPSNVAGMRLKGTRELSSGTLIFNSSNISLSWSNCDIAYASAKKDAQNGVISQSQIGFCEHNLVYTKTGSNTATLNGVNCGLTIFTLTFTTPTSGTFTYSGNCATGRTAFYLSSGGSGSRTFTLE